jgi:hypothetical protein
VAHGNFFKNAIEAKEKTERQVTAILTQHSRKKKGESKARSKRKSPDEMLDLVPFVKDNKWAWVRDPYKWKSKSYNYNRHINDFAKWIFCEYPVPYFMLSIFHRKKTQRMFDERKETFFLWLLAVGQGQSFSKMIKGILSKKEAHLFLQAPKHNTIVENIWWARCKGRNLYNGLTDYVVKRFGRSVNFTDVFWIKTLDFFDQYQEHINVVTIQEILDFLFPRHANDTNFSLKGRTINSLIQLSNEWHRQQQATKHGKYAQWDGMDIDNWHWKNKVTETKWSIKQIRNSKELYNEGRKMRHCVYGYVLSCVKGSAAIFTMESGDETNNAEKHLTIEVLNGREVTQARGKLNRTPNNMESKVLFHWAQDRNLVISNWMLR